MNSGSAARLAQTDADPAGPPNAQRGTVTALHPLTVLIVVPTLQAGAAEAGAVDLVKILTVAGHKAIVLSRGGRLEPQIKEAGGEFIYADVASKNPAIMARNVAAISRIVRKSRLRHHPCAWPRAGLERLHRFQADARAVRHQLVQGLPRTEFAEAPL